ncbi:hypothetical protein DYB13_17590 [Vibrio cholerae]|nr:hypothetical protein [Vibrio cholerae]EGR2476079.1 hypothetical protein [Vibrio cholerae]
MDSKNMCMKKTLWSLIVVATLFVLKPFINAFGCDYKLYQESPTFEFSSTCNRGFVVSDIHDMSSNTRFIRKALYGYWNGYSFNIPVYEKIWYLDGVSNKSFTIDPFSRYTVMNLWSLYSYTPEDGLVYSFLEDNDGHLFYYRFDKTPIRGFIN